MLVPLAFLAHRHRHRLVVGRRDDVSLPAADQRDVTVWARHGLSAAAVDDRVPQHAARLGHVHRLHQRERDDVLDAALGVARRELDIGDDGVLRIVGIELAVNLSADALERTDGLGVGRCGDWHCLEDLDSDDVGVRDGGGDKPQRQGGKHSHKSLGLSPYDQTCRLTTSDSRLATIAIRPAHHRHAPAVPGAAERTTSSKTPSGPETPPATAACPNRAASGCSDRRTPSRPVA